MYVLDYLVYHLRPYGIVGHSQPLPKKLSLADVVLSDDLSRTTETPTAGAKLKLTAEVDTQLNRLLNTKDNQESKSLLPE